MYHLIVKLRVLLNATPSCLPILLVALYCHRYMLFFSILNPNSTPMYTPSASSSTPTPIVFIQSLLIHPTPLYHHLHNPLKLCSFLLKPKLGKNLRFYLFILIALLFTNDRCVEVYTFCIHLVFFLLSAAFWQ